ncbi:MAG: hypothetical protein K6G50_10870 [bacterium]|nr:hypothetical protein [bacterium]
MRKFTATLCLLATLTIGGAALTSAPAMASDVSDAIVVSNTGNYDYKIHLYPSYDSSFFFFPKSYVEFDSVNGKYWSVVGERYNINIITGTSTGLLGDKVKTLDKFNVHFYGEDGEELGFIEAADMNRVYSFPRDGKDHEKIKVRVECYGADNTDVKFQVWEPVEPVVAKPIDDGSGCHNQIKFADHKTKCKSKANCIENPEK